MASSSLSDSCKTLPPAFLQPSSRLPDSCKALPHDIVLYFHLAVAPTTQHVAPCRLCPTFCQNIQSLLLHLAGLWILVRHARALSRRKASVDLNGSAPRDAMPAIPCRRLNDLNSPPSPVHYFGAPTLRFRPSLSSTSVMVPLPSASISLNIWWMPSISSGGRAAAMIWGQGEGWESLGHGDKNGPWEVQPV